MELSVPSGKHARSIVQATARTNIWDGSVRSGKTVSSLIAWLNFVNHGPAGPLLMIGKTERTLWRNILEPVVDVVGQGAANFHRGTGEGHLLGRKVYLASANDSSSEGKIRGMTAAGAYGDELTLWPESFFKMLLSRLSIEGARSFGTTNPDGPRHWLKRGYLDRANELDLRAFHFQLRDNPTLPPAYIRSLEAEYTGLWHRRFIKGEWCLAEGVIWDQFDPDRHVLEAVPTGVRFTRYWLGVDYGTANPFVALVVGETAAGEFYVLDEWRWDSAEESRQKTDAQYSREVRRWLRERGHAPHRWLIDPSAASFIEQVRQDGVATRDAENDVLDGLRIVNSLFGADRLWILERCQGLIDEITGYCWDEKAQERGEDKPVKQSDHGPDALRYVCATVAPLGDGSAVASAPEPQRRGRFSPYAGRRAWA